MNKQIEKWGSGSRYARARDAIFQQYGIGEEFDTDDIKALLEAIDWSDFDSPLKTSCYAHILMLFVKSGVLSKPTKNRYKMMRSRDQLFSCAPASVTNIAAFKCPTGAEMMAVATQSISAPMKKNDVLPPVVSSKDISETLFDRLDKEIRKNEELIEKCSWQGDAIDRLSAEKKELQEQVLKLMAERNAEVTIPRKIWGMVKR